MRSVSGMLGEARLLHRGTWSVEQARVLTKLDHTGIYLLIAGSYTPISLCAVRRGARGRLLGGVARRPGGHRARMDLVPAAEGLGDGRLHHAGVGGGHRHPQLWTSLGVAGFLLIFFGGVSYTVGAVIGPAARSVAGGVRVPRALPRVRARGVVLHFAAIAFVVLPKGERASCSGQPVEALRCARRCPAGPRRPVSRCSRAARRPCLGTWRRGAGSRTPR